MKLSKKLLSMVLCGLIVVGGSQATLVNANAQSRVIAPSTDNYPHAWTLGVRFNLQTKIMGLFKDWWQINLVYKDGYLRFNGCTDIPEHLTFNDTFVVGWEKAGTNKIHREIFRPCTGADAGNALGRMMDAFNRANIKSGDTIFMNGQKYDYTLRFANPQLVINGVEVNNYARGYQSIDRNSAAFLVGQDGLYPTRLPHGNLY